MALRGSEHSATRPLADAVDAAGVRMSFGLAPEALHGLLSGMLAVLKLDVDAFTRRTYVLFSVRGVELLIGACNYRISPNGDLRVIEDHGRSSRYLRRRQWLALGQLGKGILRGVEFAPECLLVAVAPARMAR